MSKNSARGSKWEATRQRILNRDGHICAYCGQDANTVDHVIAKANGGTEDESNLVAACLRCNGIKQDKVITRITWLNKKWLDRT